MKITSKDGTLVLEYCPIQNWNTEVHSDEVLRILSFKGNICNRSVISKDKMNEEIKDKIIWQYDLTDDSESEMQYATNRWVEQIRVTPDYRNHPQGDVT